MVGIKSRARTRGTGAGGGAIPIKVFEPLVGCDPRDRKNTLHVRMRELEDHLADITSRNPDIRFLVDYRDKRAQGAENSVFGRAVGDKAIAGYLDTTKNMLAWLRWIGMANNTRAHGFRVSPRSDEIFSIIWGIDLGTNHRRQFVEAWEMARSQLDLRAYRTRVSGGYNGGWEIEVGLDQVSGVLWHPKIVIASTSLTSKPIKVLPSTTGFLLREIQELDAQEVRPLLPRLPDAFKLPGHGMAEVETPFTTNLEMMGVQRQTSGIFVEIRLKIDADTKGRLGACVEQTRKGLTEQNAGLIGLRGINTFAGKAHANSILTAIAKAMESIGIAYDATVIPVNDGHTRYWINFEGSKAQINAVRRHLEKMLNEYIGQHSRYFEPIIYVSDARTVDVMDTRGRLILTALGRPDLPVGIVDKVDFLVNSIDILFPPVREEIYRRMESEGRLSAIDRKYLTTLARLCEIRRTVRDLEDAIWTLRYDTTLPPELRRDKKEVEKWLYEFAQENYERMRYHLFKLVEESRNWGQKD